MFFLNCLYILLQLSECSVWTVCMFFRKCPYVLLEFSVHSFEWFICFLGTVPMLFGIALYVLLELSICYFELSVFSFTTPFLNHPFVLLELSVCVIILLYVCSLEFYVSSFSTLSIFFSSFVALHNIFWLRKLSES